MTIAIAHLASAHESLLYLLQRENIRVTDRKKEKRPGVQTVRTSKLCGKITYDRCHRASMV